MGELYKRLLDLDNLHEAFMRCRKGVSWKESVQRYDLNELHNIYELQKSLKDHTYRQKPFYEFDICERGKHRHIKSLHISDRVLQRALCDYVLVPELRKYLIYDNGASMEGKGVDFTRRRLRLHLMRYYRHYGNDGYVLLIDFSKYFDNIRHDKLIEILSERIQDKEVMDLTRYLIRTFDTGTSPGRGVGIGSQISQVAGVLYPSGIDNYCKIVRGLRYYGRYMDDTYILHRDREYLRELMADITGICDGLGIVINRKKTQIIRLTSGFPFMKIRYILTASGRVVEIPCRKGINRECRKLRRFKKILLAGRIKPRMIEEQYKSWRGNVARFDSYRSIRKTDAVYRSLYGGINGRGA